MDYPRVVRRKRIDDDGSRVYDCPVCRSGEVKIKDNVFYGKCEVCNATMMDYKPLDHQEAFHASSAQYRMLIGGFASGKTTASCAEIAIHALGTPNGRSLITAPTLSQVREAVIPELIKFLPPWFVTSATKNPNPHFTLTNGHEILIFSSQDQEKLRSLNLTAFYIEEASGVKYEIFDQLMTRLRNKAGVIKDKEGYEIGYKFMGIVSTNPEDGWIKDRFLLVSNKIYGSVSIDTTVYENLKAREPNRHFHSFISSTRDNNHIAQGYIERATAGKSAKWIRKYIDCFLDIQEGAVYPEFSKYLVEPFEIPEEWPRIGGFDPGFNDPTAVCLAAIDPRNGDIYIYDDYYERNQPVGYHAKKIIPKIRPYEFLFNLQADPSVEKRNDRDLQTYSSYFYTLTKIVLEPANNDILYGIEKVRDYFYSGKLKVFNSCENMKMEAQLYMYPDGGRMHMEKPIDRDNHLMDAMRYMIAKLPQNPHEMCNISMRRDFFSPKQKQHISSLFAGDVLTKDSAQQGTIFKKGLRGGR